MFKQTSGVIFCLIFMAAMSACNTASLDLTWHLDPIVDPKRVNEQLSWSPDANKIAFVNFQFKPAISATAAISNYAQVYIMDATGSNVQQITTSPSDKYEVAWSPDGGKIAFASERYIDVVNADGKISRTPERDIYVMNANGSNPKRLTDCSNEGDACDSPTWSPNGNQIAFVRRGHTTSRPKPNEKVSGIYIIGADGSGLTLLTADTGEGLAWSPGGEQLALADNGILLLDIATKHLVQLVQDVQGKAGSHSPSWSPDGKKIVFERDDELYVVNTDGSSSGEPTPLYRGGYPAWSPKGNKIAFAANLDSCHGIATIDIDGTNFVCLFKR